MCNIIIFEPGQMMDFKALANCVYNNWHSYGLVALHENNKMEVIRHLPQDGEVNPKDVVADLEKFKDRKRILHLRHNTAGATTIENTHPFNVIYQTAKDGHHLVFMHNGTLYQYKSKKITTNGAEVDDDSGPSDSKNFADQVLTPFFCNQKVIDIHSTFFRRMMSSMWAATGNRGIIISNRQEPFFIGDWKEFNDGKTKFKVANVDYFEKVTRGPEFSRRAAAEAKSKFQQSTNSSTSTTPIRNWEEFSPKKLKSFFSINESLSDILSDWDLYDREGMSELCMLTAEELQQIAKKSDVSYSLMEYVFQDYSSMFDELNDITEKHRKASLHIADLKTQLAILGQTDGSQSQ